MSSLAQVLFVVGLGIFWGAAPALNKMLGLAGVPVTHILVAGGFGVGAGLMVLQRLSGGRFRAGRPELLYGLGCAVLLSVPWALSVAAIRHVPVALTALVISTTPLWTYALALVFRREPFSPLRLLALGVGMASSAAIIFTHADFNPSNIDWWLGLTLSLPLLYASYDVFASVAWPKNMPPLTAGILESFIVGLLCLPAVFWLDPLAGGVMSLHPLGYLLLGAVTLLWVIERVCFFNMIRLFGPVTTGQSVYVSTPASVLLGLAFFGEQADVWLGVSLALLMAALWLNNLAIRPQTSQAPTPATP